MTASRAPAFLATLVWLGLPQPTAQADIDWPAAEKRLAQENAQLEKRPEGHNGTYFVICTLYYTPMESGFTAERGFDVTPETRPGLGGRTYPRDFLRSVKKEGFGRVAKPVRGLNYMRYEGSDRYGFASAPSGASCPAIKPRVTGAVKTSQRHLYKSSRIRIQDEAVKGVFGNDQWRIGDTGGGLRKWQIDLYWGEDEPLGPGRWIARPKGTTFEYGFSFVTVGEKVAASSPEE